MKRITAQINCGEETINATPNYSKALKRIFCCIIASIKANPIITASVFSIAFSLIYTKMFAFSLIFLMYTIGLFCALVFSLTDFFLRVINGIVVVGVPLLSYAAKNEIINAIYAFSLCVIIPAYAIMYKIWLCFHKFAVECGQKT